MRLGETASAPAAVPGVRVLVDVRPLGDPERAPATATYLRGLLGAYAAEPLEGESFVFLLDMGADDPAGLFPGLPVVGKRRLPITRIFRSGALTLDPFLVRGAALGAGRGRSREPAAPVPWPTPWPARCRSAPASRWSRRSWTWPRGSSPSSTSARRRRASASGSGRSCSARRTP